MTQWDSNFLLRSRFDCLGWSELFLQRLSDDPPSHSGCLASDAATKLPLVNTVTDVLAEVEDMAVPMGLEDTVVLGLDPPIAVVLLSISSRSLCSNSARRVFCSAITWVCSSSFCSWSCSCFCCSSCLTRISCISLRSTVIDAPFTFTCCCTLVISEREGVFLASRDMVVSEVEEPATERTRRRVRGLQDFTREKKFCLVQVKCSRRNRLRVAYELDKKDVYLY